MRPPRVKICGITNAGDARLAMAAGVDFLGFNFFEGSKRAIGLGDLEWIAGLPRAEHPETRFVAVVVAPTRELLAAVTGSGLFDFVQFHGGESAEFCAACPQPWIKAAPVESGGGLEDLEKFDTSWLLLDAPAPAGQYGGTGKVADWDLACEFVAAHPEKRIFLAGGITPENARTAWEKVRPYALDLASGVERSSREKDPEKVALLLRNLGR